MTDRPSDDFVRNATLLRVVDGDTLKLAVDLGWATQVTENVRLSGVNTPENRGPERPAGLWVTDQVKRWLYDAGPKLLIHSQSFSIGKFGRCLCTVWTSAGSLNQWILDCGFGWPADHTGAIVGERNIDRLKLPASVKIEVRSAQ